MFAYGSTAQLKVLGSFKANITVKNRENLNTAEYERLLKQYQALCDGIGKLREVEVKLHIDRTVHPVAQKVRQISFHL